MNKYKYRMGEEMSSDQNRIIERDKFTHSFFRKRFRKTNKND